MHNLSFNLWFSDTIHDTAHYFQFGLVFIGFYIFQLDCAFIWDYSGRFVDKSDFQPRFPPWIAAEVISLREMIVLLLDIIFFLFTRSQKAGESVMFREDICPKCVHKNMEKYSTDWFCEICLYMYRIFVNTIFSFIK